jgi:hypothetical protein
MTNQTTPVSPASAGGKSKNSNCLLRGCLIIFGLFLVVFCCLATLIAVPLVTDFDPLGLDLRHQFNEFFPWEDFLDDPSSIPDLPELFSDEIDPYDQSEEPSTDYTAPDSGSFSLVPYLEDDFPFSFSYPEGWAISEDEYADGVTFFDHDSFTYFSVGRDWIEEGWTAAYIAEDLIESLEFQAQEGSIVVFENTPYIVSTGDDAHFSAYEWIDLDDAYQWVYDINIVFEDVNIYFYMIGDDPEYFELYRDLIEAIGASYSR